MCLILFAYRSHPRYKLILASNRDEFLYRPTARIHRWNNSPIHAGKDLQAGGTWMGVSSESRWAALTNFRDGFTEKKGVPSRGDLVVNFLNSTQDAAEYADALDQGKENYNGYNLLVGDSEAIYYQSNRSKQAVELVPGVYGLSNHLLNTSWPKVETGKAGLKACIASDAIDKEQLYQLLHNKELAPDKKLPDTGIPYEWEKKLSAMFIESPDYGTRVSTVLLQEYSGKTYVEERAYQPEGEAISFEWCGRITK